ncbi:peptidoglycan/LPS O-acetylase OafA/YrhL [Leucobacter luti]|uniref:acyltransferase family protein n=1 Tax=Leucobacter luti TaxID=340320 RepID=UPI00104387BA|nr:acyltransferase family protein [Leucobacter luti]MCW2288574.1 peptidoglycan/LPS O-acetylase OafA/YrhL [Leucobacter luti]TCK45269.1 peptidoglycan/LPS O-acetylase OafA/YrhL [Leucobacter luti]
MPPVIASASASARPARFGGLDGLRAIAVMLVLGYHLFPRALPGGFLGVDVFFAISGFLITSLLLREAELRGGIKLGAFWRRRARRLLPALALVLLVCTALALLVGGDLLVGIGQQIAGTAFFVSNWVFIAQGADYFARDTPELFRNTWSLSIEEQFYILLPLLVLALLKLRGQSTRAIPLVILGAASALRMADLSVQGVDPTRVYFGSDTHTFGLLLGAAMAMLLHSPRGRALPQAPAHMRQLGYGALTLIGFGILGWLSFTLAEGSPESFQGGIQLAIFAALLLVGTVTRPGALVGRALDAQPLRWIGERSYGIYLWHWPLLLIFSSALDGMPNGLRGAVSTAVVSLLTLVGTFAAAAVSYRYVEQPVRRFGLRRSIRMLFQPTGHTSRQRLVAVALGVVLVATVPAGAIAIATAPAQSSAAQAIARGQAALEQSAGTPTPGAGQTPGEQSTGSESAPGATPGEKQPATKNALPAPPSGPVLPEGPEISAVGDSVMLASLPELEAAFPGIAVDAAVSRGLGVGVELTTEWAADGSLRTVLVVGLGTNGPIQPDELQALLATAGNRPLVLVNAHADREWIAGVNEELTRFADAHRGVVVADWSGAVSGVEGALAGDDIHPNPSGGEIYATAVQRALEELQQPGEARGFAVPRL